jgi:hypothetical protein
MSITVGTTVKHRDQEWKLDRLIHEGGFGQVFHAVQTKPCSAEGAVKIPSAEIQRHPVWSKKFEREARILGNLRHPNVVRILDFWKFADGQMAFLQEYVRDAKTIDRYFADPKVDRVGVMLQVLYALRAIHGTEEGGVIHRDLAPQNVLVDPSLGQVKIIDFGLAREDPRITKTLTVKGSWFGTPGCMAPEQLSNSAEVDRRADLYSLGKTFAAALQTRRPDHVEMDRLPRPWGDICRALAEYDRDDRPASADEAIELVVNATVDHVAPQDLLIHAEEAARSGVTPEGWANFCGTYFKRQTRTGELSLRDIDAASRLDEKVFKDPTVNADALFDFVVDGSIGEHFDSGKSDFDGVDPYGAYLTRTYEGLSRPNKLRCFGRLVRAAVEYHRYELMGEVRAVYRDERNTALRDKLLAVLEAEDTDKVIQGRGIIPRREAA